MVPDINRISYSSAPEHQGRRRALALLGVLLLVAAGITWWRFNEVRPLPVSPGVASSSALSLSGERFTDRVSGVSFVIPSGFSLAPESISPEGEGRNFLLTPTHATGTPLAHAEAMVTVTSRKEFSYDCYGHGVAFDATTSTLLAHESFDATTTIPAEMLDREGEGVGGTTISSYSCGDAGEGFRGFIAYPARDAVVTFTTQIGDSSWVATPVVADETEEGRTQRLDSLVNILRSAAMSVQ